MPGNKERQRGKEMQPRSPASDVSAVVLSIGEPTTQRAIHSLDRQTLRPRETILIRDLRPFHRALNAGAARVTTPFFVQLDADMILDPGCVATLRRAVRDETGIVVAHLRDRLIGEVVGVKLFRTSCFTAGGLPDSISPDVDFCIELAKAGWKTVELGRSKVNRWKWPTTLGAHDPSYSPKYTFAKHLLLGRRYRYRRDLGAIRWHFGRLEASSHELAVLAQVALAHGIFLDVNRDLLGILDAEKESGAVMEFFLSQREGPALQLPRRGCKNELFDVAYHLGDELFRAGSAARFRYLVGELNNTRWDPGAWITKIGLCRGLLAGGVDPARIRADFSVLRGFLASANLVVKAGDKIQRMAVPLFRTFARTGSK
jgi:hypothetical protein